MNRWILLASLTALAALVVPTLPAESPDPPPPALHHDLSVTLVPETHRLSVLDRLRPGDALQKKRDGYPFLLHARLDPRVDTPGWSLRRHEGRIRPEFFGINATSEILSGEPELEGWILVPTEDAPAEVEILYAGTIHHPIRQAGQEHQRGFRETPGIITEEGVFLGGASYWIPSFGDGLVTFSLEAVFPGLDPDWDYVSQGQRTEEKVPGGHIVRYDCTHPVDEIYLVGGPWTLYEDRAGETKIYAFLRRPDPALAGRYLEATRRYLAMYESLLTPYPWSSFALAENFWDTGYGMPGFTLLGPRIIRFPFILTSSYPHEILHNWWGNSVYIDPKEGNWAEGLTAYMADHLFAEQRGEGWLYRRNTLQKYADFVREGGDFPLEEFRSRHSPATEAVGYGKALMVFHTLRRRAGDEAFLSALSRFHRDHLYERAGFSDLARALAEETGADWQPVFEQWVEREGAPELVLKMAEPARTPAPEDGGKDAHPGDPWTLRLDLRQVQRGRPYDLRVPVALTLEGRDTAEIRDLEVSGRRTRVEWELPARPLRVDVDPRFDVMRRLDPMEVPPALSTLLAEEDPLFLLPSEAPVEAREAWEALARSWAEDGEPRMRLDAELDALPEGPLWVLGWENRHRETLLAGLAETLTGLDPGDGVDFLSPGGSRVVMVRDPQDPKRARGWIAADTEAAIPGLARKLPHYTRYSWLSFRGPEPTNTGKGQWETSDSPLSRGLTEEEPPALRLADRPPLAEPPPRFDPRDLAGLVEELSGPEMEGRGLGSTGLLRATTLVAEGLERSGLQPLGTDLYRESWTVTTGNPRRPVRLTNLLAYKPGTAEELAAAPVLVMAHLDHLGRGWPDVRAGNEGMVHPGADDNASGVAVLLELARALGQGPPGKRPVLLAFTTGEEADLLGSRKLLESLLGTEPGRGPDTGLKRLGPPFACINLDTVGRLGDDPLLVLNADSAREWRFLWMGVGYTTGLEFTFSDQDLRASDQAACLERGIPAVQLTTGAHEDYHRPTDTAAEIDAEGLAAIAEGLLEAVRYLADREEPLTSHLAREGADGEPASPDAPREPRRAFLGTVPDFTWEGPGVRLEDVVEDSPAARAGLAPGDVLTTFDGRGVEGLRAYAALLRGKQAGDTVQLGVLRDGILLSFEATLARR